MSIQDPNDPGDWLPNEFPQPSATPGERPRLPEPWWWEEESQHIVDNDDHALSLLDAEMLGLDDGKGRVFAIPLVCVEALIGRRLAATPARLGERPKTEAETYAIAAENALRRIAKACGFDRTHDYPLQIVSDVEDRMRELAALKAASPGERVPGGGPPRCEVFDSLTGMRCAREAGHPGMHAHDDSEHPGVTAPAVSPPLRDEPATPEGGRGRDESCDEPCTTMVWRWDWNLCSQCGHVHGHAELPNVVADRVVALVESHFGCEVSDHLYQEIESALEVDGAAAPATREGRADLAPDGRTWRQWGYDAASDAAELGLAWEDEQVPKAATVRRSIERFGYTSSEDAHPSAAPVPARRPRDEGCTCELSWGHTSNCALRAHEMVAPALAEPEGTPMALLAMTQSRDDWRCAYHAMAHRARRAEAAPVRDETVPPPGWRRAELTGGATGSASNSPYACRVSGGSVPIAEAWAQYDAEHGYAPAAPATREGRAERGRRRGDESAWEEPMSIQDPNDRQPPDDAALSSTGGTDVDAFGGKAGR